jgi:hypothetical protein
MPGALELVPSAHQVDRALMRVKMKIDKVLRRGVDEMLNLGVNGPSGPAGGGTARRVRVSRCAAPGAQSAQPTVENRQRRAAQNPKIRRGRIVKSPEATLAKVITARRLAAVWLHPFRSHPDTADRCPSGSVDERDHFGGSVLEPGGGVDRAHADRVSFVVVCLWRAEFFNHRQNSPFPRMAFSTPPVALLLRVCCARPL